MGVINARQSEAMNTAVRRGPCGKAHLQSRSRSKYRGKKKKIITECRITCECLGLVQTP
jgi:hypothetical protein